MVDTKAELKNALKLLTDLHTSRSNLHSIISAYSGSHGRLQLLRRRHDRNLAKDIETEQSALRETITQIERALVDPEQPIPTPVPQAIPPISQIPPSVIQNVKDVELNLRRMQVNFPVIQSTAEKELRTITDKVAILYARLDQLQKRILALTDKTDDSEFEAIQREIEISIHEILELIKITVEFNAFLKNSLTAIAQSEQALARTHDQVKAMTHDAAQIDSQLLAEVRKFLADLKKSVDAGTTLHQDLVAMSEGWKNLLVDLQHKKLDKVKRDAQALEKLRKEEDAKRQQELSEIRKQHEEVAAALRLMQQAEINNKNRLANLQKKMDLIHAYDTLRGNLIAQMQAICDYSVYKLKDPKRGIFYADEGVKLNKLFEKVQKDTSLNPLELEAYKISSDDIRKRISEVINLVEKFTETMLTTIANKESKAHKSLEERAKRLNGIVTLLNQNVLAKLSEIKE